MEKYIISPNTSIRQALKVMDEVAQKVLFIEEDNKLIGALSDGDIRRALLQELNLGTPISNIINKKPTFVREGFNTASVKKIMLENEILLVPVVNKNLKIIDILHWHKLFGSSKINYRQINLPVVIMAGGKGTRLDPFTRILPKSLIPIGDKAMIEIIMEEYAKFGMKKFYISINHKARMIRAFFEDHENNYSLEYINEENPLGTAGALKHLEGKFDSPFFVSNCDIIIKDDYTKIYDFHIKGDYALTLVGSIQNHIIPYGVCEIENGGTLKSFHEKPQYDFLVNTGMYLLNPYVLKYITRGKFYHITHLIERLQENNFNIGVYPVTKKSWVDVGQWKTYNKFLDDL